jgi:hypothetical protein
MTLLLPKYYLYLVLANFFCPKIEVLNSCDISSIFFFYIGNRNWKYLWEVQRNRDSDEILPRYCVAPAMDRYNNFKEIFVDVVFYKEI